MIYLIPIYTSTADDLVPHLLLLDVILDFYSSIDPIHRKKCSRSNQVILYTVPTRQHELERTDHTDHTDHTKSGMYLSICPQRSRPSRRNDLHDLYDLGHLTSEV